MKNSSTIVQGVWLVLAAGFLVAASSLHRTIDSRRVDLELVPRNQSLAKSNPQASLLSVLPGGLRAPAIAYFWITSEQAKQRGDYYDAYQRAQIICDLQPDFPAVWDNQAWNLAWNISAATHTPQERWRWVENGMKLLRDRGIPANPHALRLYQCLAWIFYFKMGCTSDDMHMVYKQHWASEMQHLLGAPPQGEAKDVIDAFRPIAQAPLDKTIPVDEAVKIQPAQLELLLKDAAVADYVGRLAAMKIDNDAIEIAKYPERFLKAYNRFSDDPAAEVVRYGLPEDLARNSDLANLINEPGAAAARAKLLAFVRAQLLYNVYKLDPQYMLNIMEKHFTEPLPLDWRNPISHALYWSLYGLEQCNGYLRGDQDALDAERYIQFAMKDLTWRGRITYVETENPDSPRLSFTADARMISPAHHEFLALMDAVIKARDESIDANNYVDGHRNYLRSCIQTLYAMGLEKQARVYLDYCLNVYHMKGNEWDAKSVEEFVLRSFKLDAMLGADTAGVQVSVSLQTAFWEFSQGDRDSARARIAYARKVYKLYQVQAAERLKLPPLDYIAADILGRMLVDPRGVGYNISLIDRGRLYSFIDAEWEALLPMIYDQMARPLSYECQKSGARTDFRKLFPEPRRMDEYRRKLREGGAAQGQ